MISIRNATKKDLPQLCKINEKLGDYHSKIDSYYRPGRFLTSGFKKFIIKAIKDTKKSKVLVAEDKGKIIGYFYSAIETPRPHISEKRIGYVHNVYISDKYRRMRLGKEMYDLVKVWFKKNNMKYVELTVDSRNEIGNKAWNKFGFKEYMKKMKMKL